MQTLTHYKRVVSERVKDWLESSHLGSRASVSPEAQETPGL